MIGSLLLRLLVVAVLWLAATEAAPSALGYGLVAAPVLAGATLLLVPPRRVPSASRGRRALVARRVRGILSVLSLAGWVLWRSIVGGVDVARRALWLPRPDIAPEWSVHETGLQSRSARVALALVMNLMPGSLSASLDGARLDVHVISPHLDVHASLTALERRLHRIERAFS